MKKAFRIPLTGLLALSMCLSLAVVPAAAADRGEVQFTQAIAPQYEDAKQFTGDGLAPVKQNGKWGFIDEDGKAVIAFQYDYAWTFQEGYAVVGTRLSQESTDWETITHVQLGFVDANGKYTAFENPDGRDDTVSFVTRTPSTGFMPLRRTEDSYQFQFHNGVAWIDESAYKPDGKLIRPDTSDLMVKFKKEIEDYFSHWEDITPQQIEEKVNSWEISVDGPMNEGLIPLSIYGERYLTMDINGKIQHFMTIGGDPEFTLGLAGTSFNQGLAIVGVGDNTYGFIDRNYNWVIKPQYQNWWYYEPQGEQRIFGITGLASVAAADSNGDWKWGAIDKTGKTVIPFRYDELGVVSNGRIHFASNGKYGYLDAETYQTAIPARYEKASAFNMGLAVVYDGKNAFLIDTTGAKVPGSENLDPDAYFTETGIFSPGEYMIIQENGKYGFAKLEYLPKLPAKSEMSDWAYEEVTAAIEAGLVPVSLQNLYRSNITREEFCDLMIQTVTEMKDTDINALVKEQSGKSLDSLRQSYPFQDSSSENVVAANALGIINGRGSRVFDPYAKITRQEAAVMLSRAAKVLGMDTAGAADAGYADKSSIGSVFQEGVNFVNAIHVMSGVGNGRFDPNGSYTREQSFLTVYRLAQAAEAE